MQTRPFLLDVDVGYPIPVGAGNKPTGGLTDAGHDRFFSARVLPTIKNGAQSCFDQRRQRAAALDGLFLRPSQEFFMQSDRGSHSMKYTGET